MTGVLATAQTKEERGDRRTGDLVISRGCPQGANLKALLETSRRGDWLHDNP